MITEELYFGYTPYSKYVAMNEDNDSSKNKGQKDQDKKKNNNKRKINISAYFQNSFASELAAFMNKETPADDISNVIKGQQEQIAAQAEEIIKATQLQKQTAKDAEEMMNMATDEIQQKNQELQTIGKEYAKANAEAEKLRTENKQLKQAQKNQGDSSVNAATPQPDNQKQQKQEQEQQQLQDSSTQLNIEDSNQQMVRIVTNHR